MLLRARDEQGMALIEAETPSRLLAGPGQV